MGEPDTLTKLALDAIAKHFYNLCNKLMPTHGAGTVSRRHKRKKPTQPDMKTLAPIFESLHNLLEETIPVTLANEVTNKLLAMLDEWLCEKEATSGISEHNEAYSMLVKSIIHPLVTRIEPGQDSLDCSDIFPVSRFKNYLLATSLAKTVQLLPNLKAFHLRSPVVNSNWKDINYPSELQEFSGLCNDDKLVEIAKTCHKLKSLNVCGVRDITDSSIDVILSEMEQLEKLNIAHSGITSKGVTRLLIGLIQKGDLLKLKYLSISKYTPEHLRLIQSLPSLNLSLQHDYCTFFLTMDVFRVNDLYMLRNLHGLEITTSLREINDLLREIGSQLVYLEVTIEIVDLDDFNHGVDFSEMLLIGQYCKKLKCLHISGTVYGFPRMEDFMRPPLPGFQTVTCLKMEIESGEKDASSVSPHTNFLYSCVSQCVNVKKVTIPVDTCFYTKHELVRNLVQAGCLKSAEEVYFKLCCCECTLEEVDEDDESDQNKDDEVVQMLVEHCPNLRVVGGVPGVDKNHRFNSQRVKILSDIQ